MRIYIAGPMRGVADHNHPAFHAAAKLLRDLGHEVLSPAETDEAAGQPGDASPQVLRKVMADGLAWICEHADMVVVLPGWERSLGAKAEVATADAIGMMVTPLGILVRNDTAETTPCEWFAWIGQPFTSCDHCGRPAWEHKGEETFPGNAFDSEPAGRPWGPGEADRIRAKWGRADA